MASPMGTKFSPSVRVRPCGGKSKVVGTSGRGVSVRISNPLPADSAPTTGKAEYSVPGQIYLYCVVQLQYNTCRPGVTLQKKIPLSQGCAFLTILLHFTNISVKLFSLVSEENIGLLGHRKSSAKSIVSSGQPPSSWWTCPLPRIRGSDGGTCRTALPLSPNSRVISALGFRLCADDNHRKLPRRRSVEERRADCCLGRPRGHERPNHKSPRNLICDSAGRLRIPLLLRSSCPGAPDCRPPVVLERGLERAGAAFKVANRKVVPA
jgi:hypothetical protein